MIRIWGKLYDKNRVCAEHIAAESDNIRLVYPDIYYFQLTYQLMQYLL